MEETLTIRRSPFAALRWLVKPAALVLSCITIIVGLSATRATYWIFIFALGVAMLPLSLIILYLNFNDWANDVYTIDQNGDFRIEYRTWLRYRSVRRGPISALQDAWVVQRGATRLVFGFGDIYVQVGWSRRPFCLRDVQDPYAVVNEIKRLSRYYSGGRHEERVDAIGIMLQNYRETNVE